MGFDFDFNCCCSFVAIAEGNGFVWISWGCLTLNLQVHISAGDGKNYINFFECFAILSVAWAWSNRVFFRLPVHFPSETSRHRYGFFSSLVSILLYDFCANFFLSHPMWNEDCWLYCWFDWFYYIYLRKRQMKFMCFPSLADDHRKHQFRCCCCCCCS